MTMRPQFFLRQMLFFFLTLMSMFCVPLSGSAQPPLVLTDEQHEYPLGLYAVFFKDETRKLSIDDVTSPKYARQFMANSEEVPNFGLAHAACWVRFRVRNETRQTTHWRLQMAYPHISYVDLYLPNPETYKDRFAVKRSGAKIPFHEWDTAHRLSVFTLVLPPQGERTYYLRVENDEGIILQMALWSDEAFFEHTCSEQLWYGFYFGSLIIMACYNLFVFISLRDRSYLYYVLFVIAWGCKELCVEGFSYQYLFPDAPNWNELLGMLCGPLSAFFGLRFASNFLHMATHSPRLNRLVTILCIGWITLSGASCFIEPGRVAGVINIVSLCTLGMILIVPIKFWYDGYRPARYFVLAWSVFLVTALTAVLATMGFLPAHTLLIKSYQIGVVLLMLLLSWALADRINELKSQAEQKRLRMLELQKAKETAETTNQAKSAFLANMSHELRTPLNAILGFSQLLLRDSTVTGGQRENLETINRSGNHLLALINDVLELSKIEAGRIELHPESFDLYDLLLGLEDMFRLRTEQQGLYLVFERSPDVPRYIRADQHKLRQVLINVLCNAVKFTEEGGVALRIANCEPGTEKSEIRNLKFETEDTGAGIAPEELDNVFDAFVQTTSGQQSHQGTGLGMPISRQFVRMMGGEITVRSEVGKGSVFTFGIPVGIEEAADVSTTCPQRQVIALEAGQPAFRILIVEDEENNRELLVRLLQPVGFDIREATNGQEAIDIWEAWRPHLIWMDRRIPVLDGYEATRRIRNDESGMMNDERNSLLSSVPHCTIIALTASAFEEQRTEALESGCDDFVRKPLNEHEIFEKIRKYLGGALCV